MTNQLVKKTFTQNHYPSTAQLQKFFDSSLDVICILDVCGTFTHVSPASATVWGFDPEEMIGRSYAEFIIGEDLCKTELVIKKMMLENKEGRIENRFLCKNGNIVTVEWKGQWNENEQCFFCIVRDMSERKTREELQASYEKKIKKQHHEIREILERIADGFFAMDADWRIVYANPQVEKILAISREDYLTRSFWDCFPGMVDSEYYVQYHKAMSTRQPVHFEAFFPPFNGWFSIDAYPSKTGLSVFFRDCTEQRKMKERKKLYKKSLQMQQQSMMEVLEQMNEGFVSLDENGKVLYWNRKAEVLSDIPRETMLNKILWDVFPYIMEGEYYQLYLQYSSTQHPIHTELFSTHTQKWVALHIYPTIKGTSVFFQDITEKKNSEEERMNYQKKISQQNKQLLALIEGMKEGFYYLDNCYSVKYWNRQMAVISGIAANEILGKIFTEQLSAQAKTFYTSLFEKVIQDQKPYHNQLKCPVNESWVQLSIYPSADGLSVFVTDITEKRKEEEQIRRLSLIATETNNAVCFAAPDSRITWINDAFTRMTGYTAEEAIGKKTSELLSGPDTVETTIQFLQEQFSTGESFQVEVINYRKNGEKFWSELYGQPLFDSNGKLEQYFCIRTDITERKEMQQILDEENAKRQQAITAAVIEAQEKEREQVGRELHDNVNQVLTTVKLYAELCRDGVGDTKDILNKSIRFLQQSIDEIRSLSKRLSAPTLGNIKLKDSVKELLDTISATNKIQIHFNGLAIEDIEVKQDIHLAVYRILQEQLTNILKYAEAKNVAIRFDQLEETLVLSIKDDGKGFDPKQKRNGIGITNMLTRAQSQNGELKINSAPGLGCELKAFFPLNQQ